ncbi:hypothetical protein F4821DRAFT_249077 [Hypoxylon rubiginosum]|uniref:Uncharacterized protein n=1 Tax=Hypoxylon rubiginosum TaxID=110542 RepID=A0ACC0CM84_9PEZI|nr:hypothetical protein F4821DRAFT_249077 [Hypoxylon rubiginosum]
MMKITKTFGFAGFKYLTAFFLCLLSLTPANVRAETRAARILYPREQQTFYYLDTVLVAYESDFSNPWLHTWCEVDGIPQEKSRKQVGGFSSSALIQLTFKDGGDPCWFELSSGEESESKEIKSLPFTYVEEERVRTAILANQAGPGAKAIINNDLSVKSQTNTTLTTADCETEDSAAKMNSYSVRDMLSTHVGIGAGAAAAGIAFASLISILCIRFRRKGHVGDSKLESGGIGGRDSPQSTVFSADNPPTNVSPKRENEGPKPSHRHRHRNDEVSPIYPDESASCHNPEADDQLAKAYATDFAMADRQIWTDHIQSRVPGEMPVSPLSVSWAGEIPRVDSGTTIYESTGMNRVSSRWHQAHPRPLEVHR